MLERSDAGGIHALTSGGRRGEKHSNTQDDEDANMILKASIKVYMASKISNLLAQMDFAQTCLCRALVLESVAIGEK